MVAGLGRLRAAGLYRDAPAYHDLGTLRIVAAWEHESRPETEAAVSLDPNGTPAPWPDIRKLLPAGYHYAGGPIVQWDTPIPPSEAYELLAKMSTFKEATVYKVGESYLGQDIWAMDLMPPIAATQVGSGPREERKRARSSRRRRRRSSGAVRRVGRGSSARSTRRTP